MAWSTKPPSTYILDTTHPLYANLQLNCPCWEAAGTQFEEMIHAYNGEIINGSWSADGIIYGPTTRTELQDDDDYDLTPLGSLEIWYKPTGNGSWGHFLEKGQGKAPVASVFCWLLRLFSTKRKVNVRISNGSATAEKIGAVVLSTGTFHHIVGSWAPTGITLYIDGTIDGAPASPGLTVQTTTDLVRSGCRVSNNYPLDGELGHMRAWNKDLNPTEVTDLWNNPWDMYIPVAAAAPYPRIPKPLRRRTPIPPTPKDTKP